jgi:hypothetical protein
MRAEDLVTFSSDFDVDVESISVIGVTRNVPQPTLCVFCPGVVIVQDPPAVLEARGLRKYVLL